MTEPPAAAELREEGLEDLLGGHADLVSYGDGGEVVGVDLVGAELVADGEGVEEAGGVGLAGGEGVVGLHAEGSAGGEVWLRESSMETIWPFCMVMVWLAMGAARWA